MKGFFRRIGDAITRFMYGRNGYDELSMVLLLLSCIFTLLSYIPYAGIAFTVLSVLTVFWSFFRVFSKNVTKRRAELARYYRIKNAPKAARQLRKNKKRDKKTHLYFKCKRCRAVLRVPKNRGSIIVTCPRCSAKIEKKT